MPGTISRTSPNRTARAARGFSKVKVVDLTVCGTDPSQAMHFIKRTAVMPEPAVNYSPKAQSE